MKIIKMQNPNMLDHFILDVQYSIIHPLNYLRNYLLAYINEQITLSKKGIYIIKFIPPQSFQRSECNIHYINSRGEENPYLWNFKNVLHKKDRWLPKVKHTLNSSSLDREQSLTSFPKSAVLSDFCIINYKHQLKTNLK